MFFWDNLVVMDPPKLRRTTHELCGFCFNNLNEYGQKQCDRCLLSLRGKGMVISGPHERIHMRRAKYFWLTVKSRYLRFARWCGC